MRYDGHSERQEPRGRRLELTPKEEEELRDIIRSLEPEQLKNLKELLRATPDLLSIVEGKRVTAGVYRAIGEFSKWAAGIVAILVAYYNFYHKR